MKLGGWLRLWIVLCAILLLAIAGAAYVLLPSPSDLPDSVELQAALSPEARAQMAAGEGPDTIAVNMPNGHTIHLKRGIEAKRSTPVLAEYYSELQRQLFRKRVNFIAGALVVWLGVSGAIYAVGWSVGWVYRGFKSGSKAP